MADAFVIIGAMTAALAGFAAVFALAFWINGRLSVDAGVLPLHAGKAASSLMQCKDIPDEHVIELAQRWHENPGTVRGGRAGG